MCKPFTEPSVYRAYSRLLERVEAMMREDYPDDMATVALDSQDEATDTKRALAFGNFLYGNTTGRTLTHIAETPFFVSSKATVGIQIADLLAYALAQQNQGRQDIKRICDRTASANSNGEAPTPWRGTPVEGSGSKTYKEAPTLLRRSLMTILRESAIKTEAVSGCSDDSRRH